MNKILVSGATGNTGNEVVKQLLEKGIKFKAMSRNKSKFRTITGVNWVEGDFADIGSLVLAFDGVECIYVAMPAHPDNEVWLKNVILASKKAGVKHIVKLSGMGVSQDAGSEIIRVHAKTDNMIIQSWLEYTLLRSNSFYQNIFASRLTIKNQSAIYSPLSDSRLSLIDIRDVAAVAVKALTENKHKNKIYTLTGPEALSYFDIAKKIGLATGKDITYVPISKEEMKSSMLKAGVSEWRADKLSEILAWFGKGGFEAISPDVESVLNRSAYSFDEFLNNYKKRFQ
ncbi:MAG: SDR family oxidoreductase [Bacteroidetes bacterium]|nr:SDR family oxidoreductase [Bacteroidota bacterium]